ncbi:MAG: hypothetical protein NE327_22285 [Lentisphaeraceae bacterium]|nr:hypothetical protein [Lentisphaeraceae bacterium]
MSSKENILTYNEKRSRGLELIEEYSHHTWTDYNVHDPGITILEYLCYALSDLDSRTSLPIKDILSKDDRNLEDIFDTAEEILPSRALTVRDYRKLIINMPLVKNAWLSKEKGWHDNVYMDPKKKRLTVTEEDGFYDLQIKGFYKITVQFHDIVKKEEKPELLNKIWKKLHNNRNLCEDFLKPESVTEEPIGICFDLHVEPSADIDEVMAEAACRIQSFISPVIRFYTLSQMKEKGHNVEDIFNGPFLSHGFIDNEEIDASEIRTEIHASDIIQILMDIPGIIAVKRLLMTSYRAEDMKPLFSNKKWVLPISPGKAPEFNLDKSRFIVYKNDVPYFADIMEVKHQVRQLKAREFQRPLLEHELLLKLPLGKQQDLKTYPTIQNHFPLVYGIGQEGLPLSASEQRKSEALQLKGFILVLEQFMANYLAQLDMTSEFFSHAEVDKSYYTQLPENIRDIEKLLIDSSSFLDDLQKLTEDEQTYLIRRNRFLDHLLARFNEDFSEYSILAEALYGSQALDHLKHDKMRMLDNYADLSKNRAAAHNYLCPPMSPRSGLEKKLRVFLNMLDDSQNVFGFSYYRVYQEIDDDGIDEYRFEIFNEEGKNLLSSTRHFHDLSELYKTLRAALQAGTQLENYKIIKGKDKLFYFKIELEKGESEHALARKIDGYKTKAKAQTVIKNLIKFLKDHPPLNKIFVLEHSLFRPHKKLPLTDLSLLDDKCKTYEPEATGPFTLEDQDLLNACVDPKCVSCSHSDPYSFRVSVVLPYAVKEFQDMNFRRYLERYIREQAPAHILVKICWIETELIYEFNNLYATWRNHLSLYYRSGKYYDELMFAQRELIEKFKTLSSVYPTGYLHDCANDEQKRPIVLGQSKLGIFEGENND